MIITIIILYDDSSCEHYVGAWAGAISPAKRQAIANKLAAKLDGEPDAHEEDCRTIGFREVQAGSDELVNIWGP
jgi:hypothetical protein